MNEHLSATHHHANPGRRDLAQRLFRVLGLMTAAALASCAAPPAPPPPPPPRPAPAPAPPPPPPVVVRPLPSLLSNAGTPREYRLDGARHIYSKHGARVFKGKMPPLLQGVGVMELDINERGEIVAMNWMRPPSHAGAKAEIERTVRASAPFPAPHRMGRVRYTDTWLWHESGRFQLDTLTEGQNNR